jgi:hypothetical protein
VSEPLVIVGNRMAAVRLADELTRCALGRHAIAVIGDEPRLAYTRVLVSSVLAGETALEAIELKPMSSWHDSPSQAQGAASLEFLPTFSAPHRRGDRIGWLLPVLALFGPDRPD